MGKVSLESGHCINTLTSDNVLCHTFSDACFHDLTKF